MTKPPLATTISSLLVCSIIAVPTISLAQGYRGGASSAAEREKARRYDYERRGREAIDSGDRAMKDRDYEKATAYYKNACDIIPNAPNSRELYEVALRKFCDASVKLAEQRITEGRYADAENTLRIVLDERYDPRCKDAIIILARLEQPDYYNKTIGPQFRASVEQVKQWFIEAEGFYDTGRFDLAKKRCEQILNVDKYNIAARQMQEKIDRKISDYGVAAYNETRADAMKQVDLAWQRPIRRFNLPTEIPVTEQRTDAGLTERIRRKLERIIIPKLEFREATIREAIEFLKKKSVELDVDSPAGDKGVNIVLKLETTGGAAPTGLPEAPPPGVPGIPGLEPAPAAVPAMPAAPMPMGNPGDARITVSLGNIPLIEALRYVTGLANLKFKVEPYAVSVVPLSEPTDVLVTKEWKIPPDLIPRTPGAGGAAGAALAAPAFGGGGGGAADASKGGSGIADRESAKNWLIANGVTFNGAASAIYIVRSSRLIVRNTQDQLDLIDTIIETGGRGQGPTQVEIEAKFVEISQNNLKELSFDWLVGAFNIGNERVFGAGGTSGIGSGVNNADFPFVNGGTPIGGNPITGGNRSGQTAISSNAIDALLFGTTGVSAMAPGIAAISGVFTDPQFQVVIRALNQKKGVDLLSAPRVTTKSGQRAVIEIIREFRYPTEFDPPQIPQDFGNIATTGLLPGVSQAAASFPVTPTTPTAFETRNTGVTLEVEPVVGPDGYTIDLNLVPQVVEFEGFINYGSPIQTTSTNALGQSQINVLTENVINQPIFSTRKVTTSVSIFDGSTVMLGGLIREDVQKVEDKVPFFGDIPVIGRLFRSSVDQHLKRNLVIFVSARLINPAGEPVRSEDEKEEVIEMLAPPELGLPTELPLMSK
jgi:general secretion pathway protein D